jgi:hypothetical protein
MAYSTSVAINHSTRAANVSKRKGLLSREMPAERLRQAIPIGEGG